MTDETIAIVPGSGNVFRDLNLLNPELEQLRSILAARIIMLLDETALTVRKSQEITGFAAADFSRIRRAKLGRFTVDRLMGMLHRLDQEVEVSVAVTPVTGRSRAFRRLCKAGTPATIPIPARCAPNEPTRQPQGPPWPHHRRAPRS